VKILAFNEFINESNNSDFIDRIGYGNPTRELLGIERRSSKIKDWFISKGLDQEIINSVPGNTSKETLDEMKYLIDVTSKITEEEIKFAEAAEKDLVEVWNKFVNELGYKTDRKEIQSVIDQTDPVLFYLKNKINRIRPFQLAYYLSMEFYPVIHSDANSAAYPSGHGLDSFNLSMYFATKFPEDANKFLDLGERIAKSREQIGVHYPSDTEISREMAKTIWENKLIDIQ
jgi:acid phosphatase (class A)